MISYLIVTFMVLNFKGGDSQLIRHYMGCYQTFDVYNVKNYRSSVTSCIKECKDDNHMYTFAALKNGNECYCGNNFGILSKGSKCQKNCSTSSSEICGGESHYSVYSVCLIGTHGEKCDKPCIKCQNSVPCKRNDGECFPPKCYINSQVNCDIARFLNNVNVAFNRPAYQSSTYEESLRYPASLAVDGNNNTHFYAEPTCSHTKDDENPWFYVDLQVERRISNVVITNRGERSAVRLHDVEVLLSNITPNVSQFPNHKCNVGIKDSISRIEVTCNSPSKYRYLVATIPRKEFLTICEIEAYLEDCMYDIDCEDNEECDNTLYIEKNYYSRCVCKSGFLHVNSECTDIDECTNGNSCNSITSTCHNNIGSYTCQCKPGYHNQNPTTCVDFDECRCRGNPCDHQSTICRNTFGSYYCECKDGYQQDRNDPSKCTDIDECETEKYDSTVNCTNLFGSVNFKCQDGLHINKENDILTCSAHSNVGKIIAVIFVSLLLIVLGTIFTFLWKRKRNRMNEIIPEACLMDITKPVTKTDFLNADPKQNSTGIKTEDIINWMSMVSEKQCSGFEIEFEEISKVPEEKASTLYAQQQELKSLNRFQNILPYDDTRVILSNTEGKFSDYINASHITDLENTVPLIAAQGPTEQTVNDFWRMITEQHVNIIVMLTELVENSKNKCFLYWPEHQGDEIEFGNILITNLSVITWNLFLRRQLKIRNKNDGSTRVVIQWHYLGWPDQGVPTDVQSFLRFRNNVRASMDKSGKTLVHCSSGVGRTGSFIAIDVLLEEEATKGSVDVVSCVRKLNQQRFQLIQTKEQYYFIYLALKVAFEETNTFIPVSTFHNHYLEMLKDKKDGKSKLARELKKLLNETFEEKKSNFYSKEITIPSDKWKVYSDETNESNKFIYATFPPKSDFDKFWEICEQDVNVIVLLDHTKESQSTFLPTHEKSMTRQKFVLNLTKTLNLGMFKADVITMASHDSGKIPANSKESCDKQFTVFRVNVNNSEFLTRELFMAIKNQVYLVSTNQSPNGSISIFVLSRINLKLASFYVACCKLFEQMESHKEVSVYNTVLDLHREMDQPIFTLTQYKKLFEIIDEEVTSKDFI